MKGKDGKTHAYTVEASSLFDATEKAIHQWSRLWWFDPDTLLQVSSCDEQWTVTQRSVRAWQQKQGRRPSRSV
jgi:hypothetical protein